MTKLPNKEQFCANLLRIKAERATDARARRIREVLEREKATFGMPTTLLPPKRSKPT